MAERWGSTSAASSSDTSASHALVIAEVHYLLSAAGEHLAASDFLENVTDGFFDVADPSPADYGTARALIKKYEGRMERKRRKPGSLDLAVGVPTGSSATDLHLSPRSKLQCSRG
jgi:hypothetical protein